MLEEKKEKKFCCSLSKLEKFFQKNGTWKAPYPKFSFLGSVLFKTIHTTFFMKDYELDHFLYIFGYFGNDVFDAFETMVEKSKELLTITEDHYLSSFCLLACRETEPVYRSKSLWLGFKGRVEWGIFSVREKKIVAPREMGATSKFLESLCFKG